MYEFSIKRGRGGGSAPYDWGFIIKAALSNQPRILDKYQRRHSVVAKGKEAVEFSMM